MGTGIAQRVSGYVKQYAPLLHRQIQGVPLVRQLYTKALAHNAGPDISVLLHALRSAQLRRMPKVDGTFLSAGCAGKWYFDWIKDRTGHCGRHVGIEFYMPKPEGLPPNVEWIANTVGNMSCVGDETCDLVFSGQNLEHLWPEEVAGFFCESNRVLKDGGWLVVDSPNRLLTEPLNWSHPEHTVEYTPAEAVKVASLAGFEVVDMIGLWTCRDPSTKHVLPFLPDENDQRWSLAERVAAAHEDPENSFIWWMVARKTGAAKIAEVENGTGAVFVNAWPERKTRFVYPYGKTSVGGKDVAIARKGQSGPLVYGPYMPLKAGHHRAEFVLTASDAGEPGAIVATCDVVGRQGQTLAERSLSSADLAKSGGRMRLDFDLKTLEFGIQARCISWGTARLECDVPVRIE